MWLPTRIVNRMSFSRRHVSLPESGRAHARVTVPKASSLPLLSVPQTSDKLLRFCSAVIAGAAGVALLYYGRDFFVTVIVAAVVAFLLDPAVLLVMRLRVPRGAATPIVIGVAFALIYLFTLFAWTQIAKLSEDLPTYTSRVNDLVDAANHRLEGIEQQTIERIAPKSLQQQEQQIQQKPQEAMKARRRRAGLQPAESTPAVIQEVKIHQEPRPAITSLYQYASRYLHVILLASFIPFLVYFMLSWRDRMGRSVLHLFAGTQHAAVERAWTGIAESSRAYLLGNFLLWIFLSSVSSVVYFWLGVPYWPLVGPVSAFFSLLPYVGLPLSVLPPTIAALAVPNKFKVVLMVLLATAILHVFAMNFLYAKVIGGRVRLNPLVVTIALLFWGAVWGGIGLVLAVPITAGLKAILDNVDELKPYGELLGD
jgi:predicted PurR-regulated permease PerM